MLKFNYDVETYYDPVTRIWSGAPLQRYYDRNCSIGRILFEEMRRRPKHICQICDSDNTQLTNEQVLQQAIRVARYFSSIGLTQDDIIALAGRNTTYVMGVALACFFSGIAFHATSPFFDKNTSKLLLDITKPKLIFCDGQDYAMFKYAASGIDSKIFTFSNHLKNVSSVLELLEPTEDEHKFQPAELMYGPDQTIAILCSSGSTGLPKAVTISNTSRLISISNYLSDTDVHYTPSSLDWMSGFFSLLSAIINGSRRIISEHPFSPELFLELVEKYKVTFTIIAPGHMAELTNSPLTTSEKLASVRHLMFGGSKCCTQTQDRMQSYLKNGRMGFTYGFTELGSVLSSNFDLAEKPNSVGRVLPGYKVKIIDEAGKSLGPGEIGEILVSNGEQWKGYYGNEEATKALLQKGWFHSGDLGFFDEDSYLFIIERKKDLLKYEGFHYCPFEIEEIIAQIPDVVDVCVFGIFDEVHEDCAAAAVVKAYGSNLTAEYVVDYVREHCEEVYKHLHAGAMIFEHLPKTRTGKVDRKAVKKEYMKYSGLEEPVQKEMEGEIAKTCKVGLAKFAHTTRMIH